MDMDSFSKWYNIDNNIKNKLSKLELMEAFNYAIKKGLIDVIEFIYVWHNIEYNLTEVLNSISLKIDSNDNILNIVTSNVLNDKANSDEMKLTKGLAKLAQLNKYSKMRYANKCFYYIFNSKYKSKFYS